MSLSLGSLLPLLPPSVVRANGWDDQQMVGLPLKLILPQLTTGRVVLPLQEVLSRLPQDVVAAPLPYAGVEQVTLPLDQIVDHLPADVLQPRRDQHEIELTDEIPAPFFEEAVPQETTEAVSPLSTVEPPPPTATEPLLAPPPTAEAPFEAATSSDADSGPTKAAESDFAFVFRDDQPLFTPRAETVAAEPPSETEVPTAAETAGSEGLDSFVTLPLALLIEAMPEEALAETRASLLATTDPAATVGVPTEAIVSQLSRREITLGLSSLADKLPAGILRQPLPAGAVSIPVEKIVEFLPVSLFTGETETGADQAVDEIPMPFQEAGQSAQAPVAPAPPAEILPGQAGLFEEPAPPAVPAPTPSEAEAGAETVAAAAEATTGGLTGEVPPTAAPVAEEEELTDLDAACAEAAAAGLSAASGPPPVQVPAEQVAAALAGLNSWSERELYQHNLGPTLAQRVLEYRALRGGFKDVRELLQIAGIGPKLFERVLGFPPEALDDPRRAVNRLLGVSEDHAMSLQEIVRCASQLPGVEGCIVAMSDGLYMTGELPARFDSQRVSAFAPRLFGRVAQYVHELKAGSAKRLTIFTDAQPITIFKSDDLFFIVIHKANRFSKALLNKCERISAEIARLCAEEKSTVP